ncbi:MAG: saccharopine dehydrogenase NADP-binding domain-containing protein [Alphaproteobacteria bacterium]
MVTRVLIIGGYGNFGSFICKQLAQESNLQLIIAGRSHEKAEKLAAELDAVNRPETASHRAVITSILPMAAPLSMALQRLIARQGQKAFWRSVAQVLFLA